VTIRLDRSASSVLAVCSSCPSWSALRGDDVGAWAAGADHERRVHPGSSQAANGLTMSRRRG